MDTFKIDENGDIYFRKNGAFLPIDVSLGLTKYENLFGTAERKEQKDGNSKTASPIAEAANSAIKCPQLCCLYNDRWRVKNTGPITSYKHYPFMDGVENISMIDSDSSKEDYESKIPCILFPGEKYSAAVFPYKGWNDEFISQPDAYQMLLRDSFKCFLYLN